MQRPADSLGMLGRSAGFVRAVARGVRAAPILVVVVACNDSAGSQPPPAGESSPAASDPGPAAPPATPPAIVPSPPSYPETVQGLQTLMSQLVTAIQADDPDEKARLLDSLRLPDHRAWFRATFAPELGDKLADEYQPIHDSIGRILMTLDPMIGNGQTVPEAEQLSAPEQEGATGYQAAALAKMVKRTPLYSVRLKTADGARVYHLWSFVYQGGSFRFVGKMRGVEGKPPPKIGGRDALEYRQVDRAHLPPDDG